jgi:hypothetical protein
MSQLPPIPPYPSAAAAHAQPAPQNTSGTSVGLGITGLVFAVLGLCIPGLGLAGIVIGVILLARAAGGGKGLAVASVIVGAIGLVVNVLLVLALLLPALGQARSAARRTQSALYMQTIVGEIIDSDFDGETDGVTNYNLEAQLAIEPAIWTAPEWVYTDGGTPYLLVVAGNPESLTSLRSQIPILIENPKAFDQDTLNVTYADGSTKTLTREEVQRIIDGAKGDIYNSDGTLWTP